MRKIYLASSWRNAYQPELIRALRDAGHGVYDFRHPTEESEGFHWSDIDPNWLDWTPAQYRWALQHPIAHSGFSADERGMRWADTGVLLLPCGRSAHAEAGWLSGRGRPVYVYIPEGEQVEPELMYRLFDGICLSLHELLQQLGAATTARVNS